MNDLVSRLKPNARRGSKPRCHLLTHGSPTQISAQLSALGHPFANVSATDRWMPRGFEEVAEPELDKAPLLPEDVRTALGSWWLAPASAGAMTPNFDIASTCTIGGKPGLLLVEAKAHEAELMKESAGRRIGPDDSAERKASHKTIEIAITAAADGLARATGVPWRIGRDSHYQMSNRFAWAWKLADLGVPVVLVYLGFLNASEMADQGRPFADHQDWERVMKTHSQPLFPERIWDRQWMVNGVPMIPLIRSREVPR